MDKKLHKDLIKILIVMCWISLAFFWVLKVFFGEIFIATSENENFIFLSNLIETTELKYFVSFLTSALSNYLIFCAIFQKWHLMNTHTLKGRLQNSLVWVAIIAIWAVSNFVSVDFLCLPFWFGYLLWIVFGFIYNKDYKKFNGFFAVLLQSAFSTLSVFIRCEKISILTDYATIMILILDVYIMIFLYYLYSNLIRSDDMLLLGVGWLSNDEAKEKGVNKWCQFWHNVWHVVSLRWIWGRKK